MSSALERELKYRLSDAQELEAIRNDPLWSQLALAAWDSRQLRSAYYDTASGLLTASGIALRLRQISSEVLLTCKYASQVSGALHVRNEDELFLDAAPRSPQEIPWQLLPCAAMIAATIGKEPLQLTAASDFKRDRLDFTWQHSRLELALDVGELQHQQKSVPLCELEIELKEGSTAILAELDDYLRQRYQLVAESLSKLERALLL